MRRFVVTLAALAACTEEMAPPSLLAPTEARVLAVIVEPLEAGPGDRLRARPYSYAPPADPSPGLSVSFCPLSLGPQLGYRCVSELCETPLELEPDGGVSADPTALALSCAAALGGAGTSSAAAELPEVVEMVFRVELATAAGPRTTVARIPYYPAGVPGPRNRPPVIEEVLVNGSTVAAGLARGAEAEVLVRTSPASLDEGEEPVVSFYAVGVGFDPDRAVGLEARSTVKTAELPPDADGLELYVVVRDGRGGQALRGPLVAPLP